MIDSNCLTIPHILGFYENHIPEFSCLIPTFLTIKRYTYLDIDIKTFLSFNQLKTMAAIHLTSNKLENTLKEKVDNKHLNSVLIPDIISLVKSDIAYQILEDIDKKDFDLMREALFHHKDNEKIKQLLCNKIKPLINSFTINAFTYTSTLEVLSILELFKPQFIKRMTLRLDDNLPLDICVLHKLLEDNFSNDEHLSCSFHLNFQDIARSDEILKLPFVDLYNFTGPISQERIETMKKVVSIETCMTSNKNLGSLIKILNDIKTAEKIYIVIDMEKMNKDLEILDTFRFYNTLEIELENVTENNIELSFFLLSKIIIR